MSVCFDTKLSYEGFCVCFGAWQLLVIMLCCLEGGKEQHEHSSKYHLLCFTKKSNGLVNDNITFLFLQKYSHILQLLISSNNYSVHYFITSAVVEYCLCFLSEQVKKSISEHLCTVADFANEMFDVLDAINYQSYNDFVLRVGE